jgi:uncharacterized membrane protein YphA (DoxX/SURF4 family)
MNILQKIAKGDGPAAAILIRVLVGSVFVSEGIQKFINPAEVGAGRFAKIGIPSPDILAPFVGFVEVICGGLVLLGLLTRLAVVPLIIVILTAISTTKIPILIDKGFWPMAHEARTDWSMLLGSIFLLITGAGFYSIDAMLLSRKAANDDPAAQP